MSAELILAVLGLVDGCIKLARKTITTCRAYCHAEEALSNKVLVLEARWVRLETQLEFLRRIKDHLTDDLAQCHFDLVQKLHGTLARAVAELEIAASSVGSGTGGLAGMLRVGRWKYVLRKNLDTLMSELEMWQRLFDPSWYLILLIGGNILKPVVSKPDPDPAVDTKHLQQEASATSPLDNIISLRQAIEDEKNQYVTVGNMGRIDYDASQLVDAREERISYSAARAIFRKGCRQAQIIEAVHIPASAASFDSAIEPVQQLARKLQHVDPDAFGLLSCDGVLKGTELVRGEYRLNRLEIIYRAPSNAFGAPMTLRRLLLDQPRVSLSAIVRLAAQLVRSVSYIHACDFVHKNIRPESILIFPSDPCSGEQVETIGNAFLLGLSEFRLVHDQTNLLGDTAWHRNLYRHPTRQGLCILEKYIMQHDIYALGVCLLEIGLWRTFVAYHSSTASRADQVEEGESDKVRWEAMPAPDFALELRRALTDKDFAYAHLAGKTAWVKEDLVQMARRLLPHRMGDIYANVVVDCLTCLDEDNEAFGTLGGTSAEGGGEKEPDGKSGEANIAVGVRFVESILAKVEQISV
ncbi:hypothetical protein QBC34DRAFT_466541 [Podospora aff. communis PSN243]|uniref:Protein kinase domain-containing protein n=1 Tax=Podospora aff. communis PSN243 TaxID=3040156 RepID=A0AAV9GJ55_9PEZI|nr:hypothetical protein QBC34DRAFT_466541 [Podospora aff. communis PSN243]